MVSDQTVRRFWSHVEKSNGCWIWLASKRNKGYGAFAWTDDAGKLVNGRAHRFAYELLVGVIPEGMFVLHHCDNPACVRPDHLFLGTNQDNINDMVAKGRHVPGGTYSAGNYRRGVAHHNAKLTPEIVRAIRSDRLSGVSYSELGKRYDISQSTTWKVCNGECWNSVT